MAAARRSSIGPAEKNRSPASIFRPSTRLNQIRRPQSRSTLVDYQNQIWPPADGQPHLRFRLPGTLPIRSYFAARLAMGLASLQAQPGLPWQPLATWLIICCPSQGRCWPPKGKWLCSPTAHSPSFQPALKSILSAPWPREFDGQTIWQAALLCRWCPRQDRSCEKWGPDPTARSWCSARCPAARWLHVVFVRSNLEMEKAG